MKITCIIAAYNEEHRISNVLAAVTKCKWINQIIVVNDGSADNTAAAAKKFKRAQVITHPVNKGKSTAIMTGILAAKHDVLMLLDADLVGLTEMDLRTLAQPVLDGSASLSMSLRANSLWLYKQFKLDFVSGERVFHRELIGNPRELGKLRSYGLEVYFNERIINARKKIVVVDWQHVISIRKSAKVGAWLGFYLETRMVFQILYTIGLIKVVHQYWMMLKLRLTVLSVPVAIPAARRSR